MDGLTGVANHRRFVEFLNHEWRRALRNSKPISMILIDVDFFKLYNDTYGHQSGDSCLKRIAEILNKRINRPTDMVARYGGEEFVIILSETDLKGALIIAEDVREMVEGLQMIHERSSVSDYVTISLGCAMVVPREGSDPAMLINSADGALYQ